MKRRRILTNIILTIIIVFYFVNWLLMKGYDAAIKVEMRSRQDSSVDSSRDYAEAPQNVYPVTHGGNPMRPASIGRHLRPGSIARKCRHSKCQIPDCYCGGRRIPGGFEVEDTPQMVLITFDDSVNELNEPLFKELFNVGRVNRNGCPITATFFVNHWDTNYAQVQNLYADGHEIGSHTITHSERGDLFSKKTWAQEIQGQREILSAYGGVRMEDIRGMRAPYLENGGDDMFEVLYDFNFTYDSSMAIVYADDASVSWPYTMDHSHKCDVPSCPTKSYPGLWEVPLPMWINPTDGNECAMINEECFSQPAEQQVYNMLIKRFEAHYETDRVPMGLFVHSNWFSEEQNKKGFFAFLDAIGKLDDVWFVSLWQTIQWVRNPVPNSELNLYEPFQCKHPERPPRCISPKICKLMHEGVLKYMRTCQNCPSSYPWIGNSGVHSIIDEIYS